MTALSGASAGVAVAVAAVVALAFAAGVAPVDALTERAGPASADAVGVADDRNDQFEPNDGFGSAAAIEVDTTYSGLETHGEDRDFYAVDVARGERLQVLVEFAHADGDVDAQVFDPNRDRIASSLSESDDERLSVRAGTTGTYYVLVTGYRSEATQYALETSVSPAETRSNDRFEYNGGVESATALTPPFDRGDLQLPRDDVDVYALEVPEDMRLTVTGTFGSPSDDVTMTLVNSDREFVAASVSRNETETLSARIAAAGTYYVTVRSDGAGPTDYALSASVEEVDGVVTTREGDPTASRTTASTSRVTSTTVTTRVTDETADGPTRTESADTDVPTDDEPGFGVASVLAAALVLALAARARRR
jgi:hypothetical protein